MNIFGWMHRKLNPSMDSYSKVSHREEYLHGKWSQQKQAKSMEKEPEAPLLELGELANLHHVYDGILTIGTFGRVNHPYQNEEFYYAGGEGEPKETGAPDVEELIKIHDVENEVKTSSKSHEQERARESVAAQDAVMVEEVEEKLAGPLLKEERKERTTLKDLFLASDELAKKNGCAAASACQKDCAQEKEAAAKKVTAITGKSHRGKEGDTTDSRWKKGAKGKVGDGAPPPPAPKKFRRLLIKMMRKKVHPETEHPDNDGARRQKLHDKPLVMAAMSPPLLCCGVPSVPMRSLLLSD